jgi:uncharacterized membrane protein YheB (UPF0754 family)
MKEGVDNPTKKETKNEIKDPEILRTLEEDYRKKIYETVSETVNNGLNEEFMKTPSCKAECVIEQEKISRSLYTIEQAHTTFIVRFLYSILNDDDSLKFVTDMLEKNSELLNRPPINATKEELRMIIRIINNLKKNKNFMSLLNKVNNLVKT